MKIILVGYGKMGRAIEAVAVSRAHEVIARIDADNRHELNDDLMKKADVAIEFTGPASAFENVHTVLSAGLPVVSGSTGWLEKIEEAKELALANNTSFIYASNYSIGVNIFFELNKKLAALMNQRSGYAVSLEEIHHTQKKDAPSGTAITLAEQIMLEIPGKTKWVNGETDVEHELEIISKREDPAPGTHKVRYHSSVDDIEIIHTAHNREGFALGAVMAAEYIYDKKGIFQMKDVLALG